MNVQTPTNFILDTCLIPRGVYLKVSSVVKCLILHHHVSIFFFLLNLFPISTAPKTFTLEDFPASCNRATFKRDFFDEPSPKP